MAKPPHICLRCLSAAYNKGGIKSCNIVCPRCGALEPGEYAKYNGNAHISYEEALALRAEIPEDDAGDLAHLRARVIRMLAGKRANEG